MVMGMPWCSAQEPIAELAVWGLCATIRNSLGVVVGMTLCVWMCCL
jgi:hypothetical protein